MNVPEILFRSSTFDGLSEKEIDLLAQLFEEVNLPRGTEFIRECDVGEDVFLLVSGQVEVVMHQFGSADTQVNLACVKPYDTVGEFALARSGGRRSASVVAKSDVVCIKTTVTQLERFFEQNHHIGLVMYRNLFRTAVRRLTDTDIALRNTFHVFNKIGAI